MANSPILLIQQTIFTLLDADSGLNNLITGVFDFVKEDQSFPYITIGDDNFSDWSTHTFDGVEGSINIHTWTRSNGRKQCKEIMVEIYRVLHNTTLTIVGFKVPLLRFDFSETLLDPDGQTYHGIQRFKILTGSV